MGSLMPADTLELIERLEPKDKWEKAKMEDIKVWAWETKSKMKRGEYDRRTNWMYLYDLAWQDVIAGRPPREAVPEPVVRSFSPVPGQGARNEKQAEMLRQMLPDKLPRMDQDAKTGEEDPDNAKGADDPSQFNQHLRRKDSGTKGGTDQDG